MTTWKKEEFDNLETTDVLEKSKELGLTQEQLVDMYRTMVKIRLFEEMADKQYALGKVHGTMHLSAGQDLPSIKAIICSTITGGTDISFPAVRM